MLVEVFRVPIPGYPFGDRCDWIVQAVLVRRKEETLVHYSVIIFTSHVSFDHRPSTTNEPRKSHERLDRLSATQLPTELLYPLECDIRLLTASQCDVLLRHRKLLLLPNKDELLHVKTHQQVEVYELCLELVHLVHPNPFHLDVDYHLPLHCVFRWHKVEKSCTHCLFDKRTQISVTFFRLNECLFLLQNHAVRVQEELLLVNVET